MDCGVVPGPLDDDDTFGVEMNRGRMVLRRAYQQGLAYSLASSRREVPFPVIAATCDTLEEAEDLAFTINADRAQSEAGF